MLLRYENILIITRLTYVLRIFLNVETLFEEKQDILQLLIDQRNALLTRIADDKLKQETALAEYQWRNKYGALEGNKYLISSDIS